MRRHVLVAIDDPTTGRLVADLLQEVGSYSVTQALDPPGAFAVARSSLHPLVVVVDDWIMKSSDIVSLFTDHADEMPHLEWVAFGYALLTDDLEAFLTERAAERVVAPFKAEDLIAAIGRAADRLPSA
jgi:CheY-like chemotaxis protein